MKKLFTFYCRAFVIFAICFCSFIERSTAQSLISYTTGAVYSIPSYNYITYNPEKVMTSDLFGNIYFIDDLGRSIKKISNSGAVTTVFTNSSGYLIGNIACDASGNLYYNDHNAGGKYISNSCVYGGSLPIYKVNPDGTSSIYTTLTIPCTYSSASGVQMVSFAFDGAGNVFIAVNGNVITNPANGSYQDDSHYPPTSIYKITPTGTVSIVLSSASTSLYFRSGMICDNNGNLYIVNATYPVNTHQHTLSVMKILQNGSYSSVLTAPNSGGVWPNAIYKSLAIDLSGNLFVSWGGGLEKVAPNGTITNYNLQVSNLVTDASGNLYTTEGCNTFNFDGIPTCANSEIDKVGFQAPVVKSFTPASAVMGDTVTIRGSALSGTSAASFGGIAATSFQIINDSTITAIVGNGTTGNVTITTGTGSASLLGFTFLPTPTVTSFSPTTATTSSTVTIIGTNFTGATGVSFGGVAATSFKVVSPTSITAVVGSGASGSVSVTGVGGGKGSLNGFNYLIAPAISYPSVTKDYPVGAAIIALTPTNTGGAVQSGGYSISPNLPTGLTLNVNTGVINGAPTVSTAANTFTVTALNLIGTSTTTLSISTFAATPIINSYSPATATNGTTVVIRGLHFTNATEVSFGTTAATSYTVTNDSIITAIVGSGASGSVSVTTDGGIATKTGFNYVLPPAITSFTPTKVKSGATVTISGNGFTGATLVTFGGVSAISFAVLDDNTISAVVGDGATGSVSVTTLGVTTSFTGFELIPSIYSFTPKKASAGTTVSILGSGFTGATSVSLGGVSASSFTTLSDNLITAIVAGGASGNVDVTTSIGSGSLSGFTFIPTYTWSGTSSSDWNTPGNWNSNIVPTSTTNVIIPSSTPHQLMLSGDANANSLQLDGSVNLNGHSLTLSSSLSGSGTIEGSGTSSLFLSGSNDSIGNLKVSSGNFTISGATLYVTNQLTVSGGTLHTGGKVILASTANNTAIISYPLGGAINGTVSVQRYIPQDQGAAFRDLGVCVTGGTVADLSNQAYGYTNGVWSSALSSSTLLVPGAGYRAQVNTTSGPVTLGVTGTLVTGSVSPTLAAGNNVFSFIANPYQSQVDFNKVTSNGLYSGYWYLDPTSLSNGYEDYNYFGTDIGASNIYKKLITQYLQPGQGIFVCSNTTGTPTLTFTESATDNTNSQQAIFGAKVLNRIATGLFVGSKNVDGAVAVFNSKFSNSIGKEDGTKISNHGANLTFLVGGKDLCANGWAMPSESDVLPLHLYNLSSNTTYTLKLDASQFIGNGLVAYLKDNTTKTQTLLSGNNNEVSFTTTTNATAFANRYSIVFGKSALPVSNIILTASSLRNSQVSIQWRTVGENNISSYQVERSTNGTSFTALATVSPSTAHSYNYVDASSNSMSVVYYRIKVIDITGAISFSKVVICQLLIVNHQISVFPNPVSNGNFSIGLENIGKYTISLIDKLGHTVYSNTINHSNTTNLESISLNKKVATGSYILKATDANGNTYNTTVIIK